LFGLGLALYFAAQGAGRLLWPVLAGFSRLAIASVGGWLAIHGLGGELIALFAVMALAFVVFGLTLTRGVRSGAFGRGDQSLASDMKRRPCPRDDRLDESTRVVQRSSSRSVRRVRHSG
jgi:hypothetical protein